MTTAYALTYDNLVSTVLQYLERSDAAVVGQMPVSIMLAEFDIATRVKTLGQIMVAEFNLSPATNVVQKPARWRKTTSMTITVNNVKQPVFLRKLEYVNNYVASGAASGPPLFYSDYDYDHWVFGPTPDQAYAVEVLYYERLAPLASDNQTNWLTNNAPQALLYGTLLQFMPFLKNDQRVTFKAMYEEAIAALSGEDKSRVGDRQTVAIDS